MFDDEDDILGNWKEIPSEDYSGIVNKLKNYLLLYYVPVSDPREADFHYSTIELWRKLLRIFPNGEMVTPDMVANWLHNAGFTFYDFGDLKFEWLLKKA